MTTISNPYNKEGCMWLKGQLHTHTSRSDGSRDPQTVIDEYAGLGHDFHMFSDHDTFGTYEELDDRGMLLIQGNEISANGPHMLHVNASSLVESNADRQKVIDDVAADGGFTVCNHPNWQEHFNHFPQELLESLEGYTGIEIYNGVIKRLFGEEKATDRWDMLLSKGRCIWGFGHDDSHGDGDPGQAWNVVRVKDRTVASVVEALQAGSFYVSTGVELEEIEAYGRHIRVKAANADRIVVFGLHGRRLHEEAGTELTYRVKDEDHGYVRIAAFGHGEAMAFTQPFFIERQAPGLEEGEKAGYEISRVDRPLIADGIRGDKAWEEIAPMQAFVNASTAKTYPFSPDVRLATDGHSLFVSIVCPEPALHAMKLNVDENGSARIWSDDGMELFIDPEGERWSYIHLMVNAAGYWYASGYNRDGLLGEITVKAGRKDYAYVLELAIPFTALGEDISMSKPWAFNITRNKYSPPAGGGQWSFTGGTNHTPHLFGDLTFSV